MLPELFDLISRRSPAVKRWLWRVWYDYLAGACTGPDWRFMNFGYDDSGPFTRSLHLSPWDESDRSAIQLYHHLVSAVDLRGRDILDVGCGRGGGCSYVWRYLQPRSVTGLDLSRRAIALCRRAHAAAGLSFHCGDAESLPFASGAFDVVINVEASHCYASMERAMAEVARVLRAGGDFLFADLRAAGEIPLLRVQLRSSGLRVVKDELITANVAAALDYDHQRKLALIRRQIPRLLRAQFEQFAGLRRSVIYEAIRTRQAEYLSCVLRKVGD